MIKIEHKKDCCGCEACAQSCPTNCISMREDNEGFIYPSVEIKSCIDCGLCEKVCPVINQSESHEPIKVYAARNIDEQIRKQSTSGGLFTSLAQNTIQNGGVVFGAKFNSQWEVVHIGASNIEELAALRGSKYSQSRIGDTFNEVKAYLKKNREVLFCGTPCQIAALRLHIGSDDTKLTTIDFICHGTPSPKVWRQYLNNIADTSTISAINFRDKKRSWNDYNISIVANNKTIIDQKATQNLFMQGFFNDLFLRPACHHCPAKSGKSGSDITLGDFWGIERVAPKFNDNKGVNLLIVNTPKGVETIQKIKLNTIEVDYPTAIQWNPSANNSTPTPVSREKFFTAIDTDMIGELQRLVYVPISRQIEITIKRAICSLLPYWLVDRLQRKK
ncbi:MAG: Coenzyme F420 hydrogenase/dehydrogenase, beta subunit C-terminal domain [Rikenellaceae bacterium]